MVAAFVLLLASAALFVPADAASGVLLGMLCVECTSELHDKCWEPRPRLLNSVQCETKEDVCFTRVTEKSIARGCQKVTKIRNCDVIIRKAEKLRTEAVTCECHTPNCNAQNFVETKQKFQDLGIAEKSTGHSGKSSLLGVMISSALVIFGSTKNVY